LRALAQLGAVGRWGRVCLARSGAGSGEEVVRWRELAGRVALVLGAARDRAGDPGASGA